MGGGVSIYIYICNNTDTSSQISMPSPKTPPPPFFWLVLLFPKEKLLTNTPFVGYKREPTNLPPNDGQPRCLKSSTSVARPSHDPNSFSSERKGARRDTLAGGIPWRSIPFIQESYNTPRQGNPPATPMMKGIP